MYAGIIHKHVLRTCCFLFGVFCLLLLPSTSDASDLGKTLEAMQQRYASVLTISGSFILTNSAPQGIEQVERGMFWIKKPALMRWEYSDPEGLLFIADGREGFLYDPQERQVTVKSLTTEELLNTPLRFLLGAGDIKESFYVVAEDEFEAGSQGLQMIRLWPKREAESAFLVLGIDSESFDLVRLIIREQDGNTREYIFKNLKTDVKIESKNWFTFRMPEGVDVHRE